MIKNQLNIAIVQFDIVWNKMPENLSKIDAFLESMSKDTDIVVLPEMFATGFSVSSNQSEEYVENSITLDWMIQSSARYKCALCGSIAMMDQGRLFNRFYFVKPDGEFQFYNKRHLFRMSDEPKKYTAGVENIVVNYLGWKFRLAVCYDLRFPVWLKNSSKFEGNEYDVLLIVANWPASRSFAWKTLLSARAIENQSYVVGVNRIGVDVNGNNHSGDSLVCNYIGEPIVEAESSQGIFVCQLKMDDLILQREQFNVALDWDEFVLI